MFMNFILILIVVVVIIWIIVVSNQFKKLEIKVSEGCSGIEVALTKRYDVLTKLFDSSASYLGHEKELFTNVIKLRQGMEIDKLKAANQEMDKLSMQLFAIAENYPQLQSSQVFVELERSIHDVEEHLQAARRLYNANVTAYNISIAIFPNSMIAKLQHRELLEFFLIDEIKKNDVSMQF